MRIRAGAGAIAVALVLVAFAAGSATAATLTAWTPTASCPDIIVLGARGSGQEDGKGGVKADSKTLAMGPEVYGFARELATLLDERGKSVGAWGVIYPAVPLAKFASGDPNLLQSVDSGKTGVLLQVARIDKACPAETKIVLAGFSQGAMVARDGAGFLKPELEARIAALVLIADPEHDPDSGGTTIGHPEEEGGILGRTGPPAYLADRTVHVCVPDDFICQGEGTGAVQPNLLSGPVSHTSDYQDLLIQIVTAAAVRAIIAPPPKPTAATPAGPASGAGTAPASATAGGDAINLVVDVSGSMGEDDGTGRIKIEGAKFALLNFLKGVEPQTPIGLRTYPAAAGSGCNPGEVRFPIDPRDPAEMAATIRTLSAGGDTPTAEAIRAAAADIKQRGYGGGTLILVSDGESTCENPCDAAKEVAAQGITLQAITIGFNISDDGKQELQCIADALDGEYVDAGDSDKLGEVFDRVARPVLGVTLEHPGEVVAEVGNANGFVTLKATIANTGGQPAKDVSARLRFDESAPGVARPIRALGNLAPGESRVVEWRFRPSVLLIGKIVKFTVVVRADNGLTDAQASGAVSVRDETSAGRAGEILRRPGKLAILGDSYSAGEGAHDYISGTDTSENGCHRSMQTYLVADFKIPKENIIACSGAVTADVLAPNGGNHVDSQLAQLVGRVGDAREAISAIVMTMGGNDAFFGKVAQSCVTSFGGLLPDCDSKIRMDPLARDGQDTPAFVAGIRGGTLPVDLVANYKAIHHILNSKAAVRTRRGVAPILVLGYPLPLPQSKRACLTTTTVSAAETKFVVDFFLMVNGIVEGAVRSARTRDHVPVFYVPNTEDAFQPDHTPCDREPYARGGLEDLKIAGTDWKLTFKNTLATVTHPTDIDAAKRRAIAQFLELLGRSVKELFHPNQAGYKAMTRAVLRWSLSQDAKNALAFTDALDPPTSSIAATWPASDVNLGQLAAGQTPTLQGGTTVGLNVDGFLPNSPLEVVAHSAPAHLADLTADAGGRARTRVAIPLSLSPGRHTIEVNGVGPNGGPRTLRIPIRVARRAAPAVMRSAFWGAGACYVLSLLAWLGLALQRRRDATPTPRAA